LQLSNLRIKRTPATYVVGVFSSVLALSQQLRIYKLLSYTGVRYKHPISGHIKKTGTHSVKVSLAHNVVATVALSVVSA
jgi:hypothetical protein